MHPSRSRGDDIPRFILPGVEIGYPDAVGIHREASRYPREVVVSLPEVWRKV